MTNPASPLLPIPAPLPQMLAAPERTPALQQSRDGAAIMGLPGRGKQGRAFGTALASIDLTDESTALDILDISTPDSGTLPLLEADTPQDLLARISAWQQSDTAATTWQNCELALLLNTQPLTHGTLVLQRQQDAEADGSQEDNAWSVALDLELENLGLVQIRLMLQQRSLIGTLTFSCDESAALAQAQLHVLEDRLTVGGKLTRPVLRVRVRSETLPEDRAVRVLQRTNGPPGEGRLANLEPLGEIMRFLLELREHE